MKHFLECDHCKTNFEVSANKLIRIRSLKKKRDKKCFCSKACHYDFFEKVEPKTISCCVCNKEVKRTKKDLSRTKYGSCCSRACASQNYKNHRQKMANESSGGEIYDAVTKCVFKGTGAEISKKLGVGRGVIERLRHKINVVGNNRYCLLEKKDELLFQVKNVGSGEIYDLISLGTIFYYLNLPYNRRQSSYIGMLKSKRASYVSIGEHLISVLNPKKPYSYCSRNSHFTNNAILKRNLERKIARRLTGRICFAVKSQMARKKDKSLNFIGCSVKFLIEHLEKQFEDGMTWENYGKWHIDHIRPCNTFNLALIEEQNKCFHFTNMRPLFARDNLARPKNGSDVL